MSLLFLRVIFLGCASASTANGAANGEAGPWDEHWENHENLQSSSKTWSDARHQVLQDDRVLPVWPAGGSPASPSGPWLEQTSEEKWLKRELLKEAHWLQHKHLVYKLPEGSAEQHAVLAQHAHDVVHGADMTYPDDPERRGHLRHKHSTGDKGSQERASLLSQFKAMQRMQPSYPGLVLSASRSNSRSNSSTSHRVAEPEKEAAQLQEEERQLRKEREKLQEETRVALRAGLETTLSCLSSLTFLPVAFVMRIIQVALCWHVVNIFKFI